MTAYDFNSKLGQMLDVLVNVNIAKVLIIPAFNAPLKTLDMTFLHPIKGRKLKTFNHKQ
jgi:hypothetical protein